MRAILDRFVKALARTLLHVFFRRVEVEGLENIPTRGPVLYVANHPNGLIDPFLVVGYLPRAPRFLAKSTLWNNFAVLPLLKLGGVIPIYRRQDDVDMAANRATFARCHEELAAGGTVALFPEGLSYDVPNLQPMKTGAARIALETQDLHGVQVQIVPVGLTYERKWKFRSRVLLRVGKPVRAAGEFEKYACAPRVAVRALTERIGEALQSVTLNHTNWTECGLMERAAEAFGESRPLGAETGAISPRFPLRQRMALRYARIREAHPERVDRLTDLVTRYDAELEAMKLRDDQVARPYRFEQVASRWLQRLPLIVLAGPVALVGAALNYFPYRASGLVADRYCDSADQPATYKLLTAFFLMPVVWLGEALFVAASFGWGAAVVVAAHAPATGYVALRVHEQTRQLAGETRAYLRLRGPSRKAEELRRMRREIGRELDALLAA